MISNAVKLTVTNHFQLHENLRYVILEEQYVSKNHPINNKLLQPAFLNCLKFYLDNCDTQATRVLLLQSIEDHLLFFNSHAYNPFGNVAYSIPGCTLQEGRRLSKNWAYALFQIFFTEFDRVNPYLICATRVYQIIRMHHCWDIG